MQSIIDRVERLFDGFAIACARGCASCIFLLQAGGIEHDQARQFARGGCAVDATAEALFDQQGYAPAMIEMGMGQQQGIDRGGIKTEGFGIGLLLLAATLEQAAINQDATLVAGDQVTGSGHLLGAAVACVDDHGFPPCANDAPECRRSTRRNASSQMNVASSSIAEAPRLIAPGTVRPMMSRR